MTRAICGLLALMTCLGVATFALAQGAEHKKPKPTEKWPHALVMVIFGGSKEAGASVTAAKVGRFSTKTKCHQAITEVSPPNYSIGEVKDWLQLAYLCVPESSP
jgi:hypothetical protein